MVLVNNTVTLHYQEAGCCCTWRLRAGQPYLFDFASAKIIHHLALFLVSLLFSYNKR